MTGELCAFLSIYSLCFFWSQKYNYCIGSVCKRDLKLFTKSIGFKTFYVRILYISIIFIYLIKLDKYYKIRGNRIKSFLELLSYIK